MTGFLENKKIEELKALYFIESRSESIIDEKIREIKSYLKDKIDPDNDIRIFDLKDEIASTDLYNFINTPSFFSIRKAAIIKKREKISKDLLKIKENFLLKT